MKVIANSDKGRIREQNEDYYYVSDGFNNYDIYMLADRNGTDTKEEKLQVNLQLKPQENILKENLTK